VYIAGIGGQGVILLGRILGRAAVIYDNKNASTSPFYSAASRGEFAVSEVVITEASERICYPNVESPNYAIIMAQQAYNTMLARFSLEKDATVFYDDLMVKDIKAEICKHVPVPATSEALKLGNRIVANMVMLGFFVKATGTVSPAAVERSIKDLSPRKFVDLNLKAFRRGVEIAGGTPV